MKKNVRLGAIAAAAMLAFVFTGCPQPAAGGGSNNSTVTVTDDEGNEISVVKTGETKSADITTQDFGAVLAWNNEEKSYATSSKIEFEELPKKGDELEVEVEFTLTASDVESVKGRFLVTDENGKVYKTDQTKLSVSSTAKAAEDSDGVTVKGKVKGVAAVNAEAVSVEFEVKITDDTEGKAIIAAESGKGITAEGKYFKADSDAKGIKIILKEGISIAESNSIEITVAGCPIRAFISREQYEKGVRAFVFPFVEAGKDYYITAGGNMVDADNQVFWGSETMLATANGGEDYTKYVDPTVFNTSTITVKADSSKDQPFSGKFILPSKDLIKNVGAFDSATIDFSIVLGAVEWKKTEWWAWSDEKVSLLGDYELETEYHSSQWANKLPSNALFAKYDNKYASYARFSFTLTAYSACSFVLYDLWSAQEVYDTNWKPKTEEEAFADGIKDVTTYISSEEEIVNLVMETVLSLMGSSNETSRTALTADATKRQFTKFFDDLYKTVSEINKSLSGAASATSFKVNFDREIDVGAMSSLEWRNALSGFSDYYNKTVYGEDTYYYHPNFVLQWEAEQNSSILEGESPFSSLNDVYDFIDETMLLKQLYLKAKADVDFDLSKLSAEDAAENTTKVGDVNLSGKIGFAMLDSDKLLKKLGAPAGLTLPVKALSVDLAADLDASATYADVAAVMALSEISSPADVDWSTLEGIKYKLAFNALIKAAVCSKDGVGGILSIAPEYKMDTANILKIAKLSASENVEPTDVLTILDDAAKVKISVSNGSKDTFSKSYKPTDLYNLVLAQIGE